MLTNDYKLSPLRECAFCECPIPVEQHEDEPYCNAACQDAHVDEAILNDVAEAIVRERRPDIFASLFPQVVAQPEPKFHSLYCSCH